MGCFFVLYEIILLVEVTSFGKGLNIISFFFFFWGVSARRHVEHNFSIVICLLSDENVLKKQEGL